MNNCTTFIVSNIYLKLHHISNDCTKLLNSNLLSELLMRVKTSVRNDCQHNYFCIQYCHFVNSSQISLHYRVFLVKSGIK